MRRSRLPVRDFVVYYGPGPLPGLEAYDVAVLEPRGWTPDALGALRARGVRCLGYLSGLEMAEWEMPETGISREDCLRTADGAVWFRPEFDTFVADPRSPRWRRHLERRARSLAAAGWDGVFLDGMGDLEDPVVADQMGWMVPAAAALVTELRRNLGDRLLVMNNGIWSLLPWVGAHLDGVCWEVDAAPVAAGDVHIGQALDRLAAAAVRDGLARWLLTMVPWQDAHAAQRAAEFTAFAGSLGFLAYVAPADYHEAARTIDGHIVRAGRA